ncbi:MAG TPA: metallophosphoesterase family protein [Corynebacteriales bacterium]|nr:metallophosphoesterase family protein [Mycobacteriales bacterium]
MTTHKTVSRRQFLAGTAAVTVGAALATTPASAATVNNAALPRAPKSADPQKAAVTDLEVLTATPTSLTFAWATFDRPHTDHMLPGTRVASDAEVWLAPTAGGQKLKCVHRSKSNTGFHFITITGLKPDTEYRFSCRSFGREAKPGLWFTQVFNEPEVTGKVRTLARPKGRYIQTVAISNDLHIGKDGESVGKTHWASVMVSAMFAELKRRGITQVYANGDLCDHGTYEEAKELRRVCDKFGKYQENYFLIRGNHDAYDMEKPTSPDPFQKVFPKHKLQTMWVTYDKKLRVIGIDSSWPGTDSGRITESQFRHLEKELMRKPNEPTLVMAHHPVTDHAARTNAGLRPFILDKDDADRLQRLFQKAPGVFFMAAGHTHRAHRDAPDLPGGPEFAQFPCTSPFPGGFTLMDIYEGGYTVSFHRTATGQALQQTALNRYSASLGFYGEYTISRMRDRCFTVHRNMSALR